MGNINTSIVEKQLPTHLCAVLRRLEAIRDLADQHGDESGHIFEVFSTPEIDQVIQDVDDLTWKMYERIVGLSEVG